MSRPLPRPGAEHASDQRSFDSAATASRCKPDRQSAATGPRRLTEEEQVELAAAARTTKKSSRAMVVGRSTAGAQ